MAYFVTADDIGPGLAFADVPPAAGAFLIAQVSPAVGNDLVLLSDGLFIDALSLPEVIAAATVTVTDFAGNVLGVMFPGP